MFWREGGQFPRKEVVAPFNLGIVGIRDTRLCSGIFLGVAELEPSVFQDLAYAPDF